MATWREELLPASFRGVTFHVESVEAGYGRRQVTHEYPNRDLPYTEDLGKRADEFTVDGYLIGAEYHADLRALIAACRDTSGPGLLVHPYRGEMTVVCRGLRTRETSAEGGMARVSMTFIEAGKATLPTVRTDNRSRTRQAATAVTNAAAEAFEEGFSVLGAPGFVLEAASAQVVGLTEFLKPSNLGRPLGSLEDFAYQVRNLAAEASDLVQAPADLAERIIDVFRTVGDSFEHSADALQRAFDRYRSDDDAIDTGAASRQRMNANTAAFNALVRQAALAEASAQSVAAEHPSYEDAQAARDGLLERMDSESETTPSDAVYEALSALRVEIVRGIPQDPEKLPRLIQYTPRATLPALVIAYQLYGDASRAAEIIARNKPRHPGFMPGGTPLEVLSDG